MPVNKKNFKMTEKIRKSKKEKSVVLRIALAQINSMVGDFNFNLFNPGKILISGIRSIFIATRLQNKLLICDSCSLPLDKIHNNRIL